MADLPESMQTPMTVADLERVLAIEAAAYSHPWTRGNFVDSLAAGYLAWLRLDAAGRCIGYCVAMPGFEEMHLLNITVAPAAQRRGHARAMLQALCETCQAQGRPLLWLEVRQSNAVARQLYTRFGFETVGLRRDYYPAGHGRREDAVVMRLALPGSTHALV